MDGLLALRERVKQNPEMETRIRHKYELKNTCGYGVNSLVDYGDPVDILMHLMIGSEGTLGFISEVTFETVPDLKLKASALLYFPSIREACKSILPLRECSVSAAELMGPQWPSVPSRTSRVCPKRSGLCRMRRSPS